jgi:hypothetical protein
MTIPSISLCIPTMNRFDIFLSKNIPKYLENPYISEIVICDETGEDFNKIQQAFPNEPKIKLFQNEKRLGAYFNKERIVRLATNEWICLMDSDNFAPISYFQAWETYIQQKGLDTKRVYMPIGSRPSEAHTIPGHRDSMMDFSSYDTFSFNRDTVRTANFERCGCLLAVGNYIFHKELYVTTPDTLQEFQKNCLAVDVLVKNGLLMLNGATLMVVPNMFYGHTFHPGSFYIQTEHDSSNVCRDFENVLRNFDKY